MTIYLRKREFSADLKALFNQDYLIKGDIYDYDKSNSSIIYDECFFQVLPDKNYAVIGTIRNVTDIKDNDKLYTGNNLLSVIFHSEPYEQIDFNTKEKKERSLDTIEKVLHYAIMGGLLVPDTIYKGSIIFSINRFCDNLIQNKLDQSQVNMAIQNSFFLQETNNDSLLLKEKNRVKLVEILTANNNGQKNGNYQKTSYSISQKLSDKEKYLIEKINELNLFKEPIDSMGTFFNLLKGLDQSRQDYVKDYLSTLEIIIKD